MATGSKKVIRSAGIVIYRVVDGSFEYLMLQAADIKQHWTPPKGRVDPGEDEWMAAVRETEEEAGLTPAVLKVDDAFQHTIFYNCKGDPNQPKTIKWWLAELVDSSAQVVISHEHDSFKWLPLEEAVTIVAYDELKSLLRSAEQFLRSRRL
uniref:Bis(5'-nucleosyl)-tetraphosphatase [asymmetrical] n=1 Tax=Plectus sambesii TaxID=2011161 RepID=A0A914VSP1_9BILA